jgi:flagellar biogenesis protein FliO
MTKEMMSTKHVFAHTKHETNIFNKNDWFIKSYFIKLLFVLLLLLLFIYLFI